MMRWSWWIPVLLLPPAAADATTARLAGLTELVRGSELVVFGEATGRESFWQDGRIFTRVSIDVLEVWSGRAPDPATIEVFTLGGVVGDVGQRVDGMPVIAGGERVALLLARDSADRYHPVGMWQGVFHVVGEGDDPPIARSQVPVALVGPRSVSLPTTLSALRRAVSEVADARR